MVVVHDVRNPNFPFLNMILLGLTGGGLLVDSEREREIEVV